MGMAASQGRLLALTARMHDIELRAQYLEAQKLSLATQQDAAYQKYCDALDATKIQVGVFDALANNGISYIDANFNSVVGFHAANCTQYSMVNNMNGKVIVSPQIKEMYDLYGGDKYAFAWAAMDIMGQNYEGQFGWHYSTPSTPPYPGPFGYGYPDGQGGACCIGIDDPEFANCSLLIPSYNINGTDYYAGCGTDFYMSEVEFAVFLNHVSDEQLSEAYENLYNASDSGLPASERREYLNTFRDLLYSKYGQEILEAMNENKSMGGVVPYTVGMEFEHPDANFVDNDNWDNRVFQKQFNYYLNLCEQITQAGGCEAMESQYASGAVGTEWFNNMVTSGMASLYILDNNSWEATTIATSVGNNYLQEVNDEEKAKKAEVEYEHELNLINRKDTKFDLQLKKLETEENACKTELDSLKKVKDDNIERTFNLFS